MSCPDLKLPGKEREKVNLYEYHMSTIQIQEEIATPDEAREPLFGIIGLQFDCRPTPEGGSSY
jgi:hypothetical protein